MDLYRFSVYYFIDEQKKHSMLQTIKNQPEYKTVVLKDEFLNTDCQNDV